MDRPERPDYFRLSIPPSGADEHVRALVGFAAAHGFSLHKEPTESIITTTDLRLRSQAQFRTPAYGSFAGGILDELRDSAREATIKENTRNNLAYVILPRFGLTFSSAPLGPAHTPTLELDSLAMQQLEAAPAPFTFALTGPGNHRLEPNVLRRIHALAVTPTRLRRYADNLNLANNPFHNAVGKALHLFTEAAGIEPQAEVRTWEGSFITATELDIAMTNGGLGPRQQKAVHEKIAGALHKQISTGRIVPDVGEIIIELAPDDPDVADRPWHAIALASLANIAKLYKAESSAIGVLRELARE